MNKYAEYNLLRDYLWTKVSAEHAVIEDAAEKIAAYDILAELDGLPKFAEVCA